MARSRDTGVQGSSGTPGTTAAGMAALPALPAGLAALLALPAGLAAHPALPAGLAALLLAAAPALAQTTETPQLDQYLTPNIPGTGIEPGVSVLSRLRPDYESSGVRAGAFTIRPQLTESTGYDSNVLGTTRPHGSPVVETEASVVAASNWTEDSLRAALTVNDVRYPSQSQQSFTNWSAQLGGSHPFGRDILSASYSHLVLNQTVTGLDTAQLTRPFWYSIDSAQLGYRASFNRVFVTPSFQVANYAYGNSAVARRHLPAELPRPRGVGAERHRRI